MTRTQFTPRLFFDGSDNWSVAPATAPRCKSTFRGFTCDLDADHAGKHRSDRDDSDVAVWDSSISYEAISAELALINEAARDPKLDNGVFRAIACGVLEVTEGDIQWAKSELRKLGYEVGE